MTDRIAWFEPDGRPLYGGMNQNEWYRQVRLDIARLRAENERLKTAAERAEFQAGAPLDYQALRAEVERLREALAKHTADPLNVVTEDEVWCQGCGEKHPCSGDRALHPEGETS